MDTDECREVLVKIYDELSRGDTKRAKTYMKSMGVPQKKLEKAGDDSDDLADLTLSHFQTVSECKTAMRLILEKIPRHDLIAKFQHFFETEPPSNIKADQTDHPNRSLTEGSSRSASTEGLRSTVVASAEGDSHASAGPAPKSGGEHKTTGNMGSVLLLNDEWGTSKGGISTVNRQVAQQAKLAGFRVYATALTADGEDEEDAKEKGVELIKADARGSKSPPNKDWLNVYHSRHFPSIKEIPNLKAIIGHVPITSPAAIDIKENCFSGNNVKVFLFNHVLPQYTEKHKESWDISLTEIKTDEIVEQAGKVDGIFSVGPRIFECFENEYKVLDKVNHWLYIPKPDEKFFQIKLPKPKSITSGLIQVLTFGRVSGVGYLKGYDVAAAALSDAIDTLYKAKAKRLPEWRIRGIAPDKQDVAMKFIKEHIKTNKIEIIALPYGTQKEIRNDLIKSALFVMPSRSEPFGMVALEAMAAGIPVLITKNSGAADFLEKHFRDYAKLVVVDVGVNDQNMEEDISKWSSKILEMLSEGEYNYNFDKAQEIKASLVKCEAIEETLQNFREILSK